MDVLTRVPVREQEPEVRAKNFEEVCYGYNEEEAVAEAGRCLNCKNAQCMKGCPVSINIPGFIEKVKNRDFEGAYQVISESSVAVYARRRASVRENVSVELRVIRLQSVNWSALSQTGQESIRSHQRKQKAKTDIRLQSSVPARQDLPAPEIWQRLAMM